jgi:pyruvate/2-oxoglutarate dehydrogenase complex dihydrolipoamide dehydrogenase (E3) component
MSTTEQYDVLVIGSGEGGKYWRGRYRRRAIGLHSSSEG